MAESLRKAHDELEQRVKERTSKLVEINVAVEEEITERKRVEEALRESEEQYRRLVELLPDGVIIHSEGKVVLTNTAAAKLLGVTTPEQGIGRSVMEFVHPDYREFVIQRIQQALQEGEQALAVEERFLRLDGTIIDVEVAAAPFTYEGKPAMLTTFRDVTERKQAEKALRESEEKYRTILENIEDGYYKVDIAGDLEFFNDALCRILGYPEDELMGMNNRQYMDAETAKEVYRTFNTVYRTGEPAKVFDWEVVRKDGIRRFIEASVSLVRDSTGEPVGFQGICRDITERKQAEEALRRYTIELEARNEDLNAFAHTVAHGLKNPVGLVVGFASVLEEDCATMPRERLQGYLNIIAQNGRRMNRIIDELLLLSGVRQMEVETSPLDMASIVTEVQQRLAVMIEEYQADIVLPDASAWPTALGYGPWVEEVWVNYLSNALKYGGQPLRVELGATVQPDGMVCFWMHNNGPSLTPEEQAQLFTPFTKLEHGRDKGHGLGLSIVRRIVEKLGGQVGVESKVGRGSVFTFTLPGVASARQ
jgi:PAS domain S-box-containing protein